MEGFFNKNDKRLWLEAIELLSNINELVREDIRDSILNSNKKEILIKDINFTNNNENILNRKNKDTKIQITSQQSSSSSLSNTMSQKKSSKKNLQNMLKINKKKSKDKNIFNKKRKVFRQRTKSSFDLTKVDINAFRPPNIWNYPLYRLRQLKKEKLNEGEIMTIEIRNVDPTKCYVDGRIQKFNNIFDNLYNNMRQYWNTGKKADTWEYFYDKVLKALNIKYISNKAKKAEEEANKQFEEEKLKKREEEEKELKEQMDLFDKEMKKNEKENKLDNIIIHTESSINNNITTNSNKEEDKKIENRLVSIKKIKLTKDKTLKILKNKINIKDEGNTNETTT